MVMTFPCMEINLFYFNIPHLELDLFNALSLKPNFNLIKVCINFKFTLKNINKNMLA